MFNLVNLERNKQIDERKFTSIYIEDKINILARSQRGIIQPALFINEKTEAS